MRIGILTYHYAYNYGAVLQCYALQEYLTSLGHVVEVIDYRNSYVMSCYKNFNFAHIKRKNPIILLRNLYHEFRYYKVRKQRADNFNNFIKAKLNLVSIKAIQDFPFDLIVVGSDQVWNYSLTNGFDEFYWGDFSKPAITILASYAASMQDMWPVEFNDIISSKLRNFDYISARERSTANKLKVLAPNKTVEQVIDPTLLFSVAQWDEIVEAPKINEPYLLLYQVNPSSKAVDIANHIAKERNLKVVSLSAESDGRNSPICVCASPGEFVGLVKFASFVVCTSFHATVFSLLYKKPFYSVKVEGSNARVETLLSSLGMLERFIDMVPERTDDIEPSSYKTVDKSASINYLNSITCSNEKE